MSEHKKRNMYLRFLNLHQCKALFKWWKSLTKKDRSELRKLENTQKLKCHFRIMDLQDAFPYVSKDKIAIVGAILSWIPEGSQKFRFPVGGVLAKEGVLEGRFSELINSCDWSDLYMYLRRLVQYVKGNLNPFLVADIILSWKFETDKDYYETNIEKNSCYWLSNDYRSYKCKM